MAASKVRLARGNTNLYLAFPAVGTKELTTMELAALYTSADRFSEVKTGSFQTSTGTVDVTNWDSGNWMQVVPNIHSGTIPVTENFLVDSTTFLKLLEANNQGKAIGFLLVFGDVPATGAKNVCIAGFARITTFNLETNDVHTISMTLTLDGEPSFAQAAEDFPSHAGVFS